MERRDDQKEEILVYSRVAPLTRSEAELVISRNIDTELLYVPISVSMYSDDLPWAEGICIRLSDHKDVTVRGNAVLGFGHLARRFGTLNLAAVEPIIAAALDDPDEYVRGQAVDAFDDVQHYVHGVP
jgi:hypothetical protein